MTGLEVLNLAREAGVQIDVVDNNLQLRARAGVLSPSLVELLRNHKADLIAYLQSAAITQVDLQHVPGSQLPIFIDIETRSAVDLLKLGGRRYAHHPTTEILSLVALLDDQLIVWMPLLTRAVPVESMWPPGFEPQLPVVLYTEASLPPPLHDAIGRGRSLCAHNARDFDQQVWEARHLPQPASWIDTLPAVRAAGMPGKLEQLGQRLLGRGKDRPGEAALRSLMQPNARGEFAPVTPEKALLLARYNIVDVLLLKEVHLRFAECPEPEVMLLDRTINERGVAFDCQLAAATIQLEHQCASDIINRAIAESGGAIQSADLTRVKFLLQWLRLHGVEAPNLQQKTIEGLLERVDLPTGVAAVLQARLMVSRTSTAKLDRGLELCDGDGRLRHLLVYHGAHTGRWTGRGVQPQNLPRPNKHLDVSQLLTHVTNPSAFRACLPEGVPIQDAITAIIRPCFHAGTGKTLVIADFASIEARGLAWCAGEEILLQRFAAGEDVYCGFATQLFGRTITKADGRERPIGKTAILGCGYSLGAEGFAERCQHENVDLTAVGLTAVDVVEGYRDAHPAIAGVKVNGWAGTYRKGGLWRDLEHAALAATSTGEDHFAGRCRFQQIGADLVVHLPSGRQMWYRDARVESHIPKYARNSNHPIKPRPTLIYTNPKGADEQLFGGKWAENVVSATCRDLLVAAMLELERRGLPVVLHVHDEIIIEVPDPEVERALPTMLEAMSTPPPWATGFPIEVEGFAAKRYFKSPPSGVRTRVARDGNLITE